MPPAARQKLDPAGRRRVTALEVSLWIGGGILVFALPLIVLEIVGGRALHKEIEAIHARGEPFTRAELDEFFAGVPDEENLLVQLEPLFDELLRVHQDYQKTDVPFLGEMPRGLSGRPPVLGSALSAPYPEKTIRAVRGFCAEERDLIDSLGAVEGLDRAAVRFPEADESLYTFTVSIDTAAYVVALDGLCSLADGQADEAVAKAVAVLRMSSATAQLPFMLPLFMSAELDGLSVQLIERALAAGACSEPVLRAVQADLSEAAETRDVARAVIGERTFQYEVLVGNYPIDGLDDELELQRKSVLFRGWIRIQAADQAARMSELVGPHETFVSAMEAARRYDRRIVELHDSNAAISGIAPSFGHTFVAHGMRLAVLRSAKTGLAVERFRLGHQRWPEGLDELVPEYLDAVPIDPFTNEPLIYLRTDSGMVIYSVGDDETDDGGEVHRVGGNRRPRDAGFMLLDEGQRGFSIAEADEDEDTDETEP